MVLLNTILLYVGSGILLAWGIAHIIPTRTVVRGFGNISRDNRLTITQTWVSEGMALVFIGLVAALTGLIGPAGTLAAAVRLASAATLVVLAVWHWLTGSRTPVVPMKICPFLLCSVALLYALSVWL
jgi:hypothetical protein